MASHREGTMSEDKIERPGQQDEQADEVVAHHHGRFSANDEPAEEGGDDEVEAHIRVP